MPCHAAVIEKPLTIAPDMEVEKALKELKKKKQTTAAVVDSKGVLLGSFSIQGVMRNLLPVSVVMADGIVVDVPIQAAPGIAKRLKKVYPLKVEELMEKKVAMVMPETPVWECVNALLRHGTLFVVEGENRKFLGMIDERSALDELQRLIEGGE